jgi:hypothetical protein
MSEFIVHSYNYVRMVELWDDVWGLPAYAVYEGKTATLFTGESALPNAERYYFDLVVPMIHGGRYVS